MREGLEKLLQDCSNPAALHPLTPHTTVNTHHQYMTTRTEAKPWDFSHVLDLVSSLSTQNGSHLHDGDYEQHPIGSPLGGKPKTLDLGDNIAAKDFGASQATLGDFAKIWQFLGSPADSPVPEVPPLTNEPDVADPIPAKVDYTSDGATYVKPIKGGKNVSWQQPSDVDEPTTDTVTDRSLSPDTPALTKTQRKKQRRKERKAKEAAEAVKNATVSENEADPIGKKSPARKASAHLRPAEDAYTRFPWSVEKASSAKPSASKSMPAPSVQEATAKVAQKLAELKQAPQTPSRPTPPSPTKAKSTGKITHQPRTASSDELQMTPSVKTGPKNQSVRQWPATNRNMPAMQFTPSSVKPSRQFTTKTPTTSGPLGTAQRLATANQFKHTIEPKTVRSGEDRHWALLMKLIGDFWADRKYLISPMNLTTHNNDPNGLHLFVDASNIFIGFTDQLKRSRDIPQRVHVPQVHLSFDGLALLMERRRPVCKRVLVGSTPHLPAFDKAKAVGYECSVLEKVYKAKELTERQIYFNTHDRFGRLLPGAKAPAANSVSTSAMGSSPPGNGGYMSSSGSGTTTSGSETTATSSKPQYAPAKMIEQGVDEILHLKMLESVVDTEVPSTIVLATGDAAQAEYSSGFMAMVERALKKGWKVELVSWSKNISLMYSRREWTQTWGNRFKIIYLDDYAEELLEM
ncbi:hypothetical protein KC347_g6651 [Hortaea werneckii]|nr:hypothetical protein KC347_g6651 [Hortaea werneckii]